MFKFELPEPIVTVVLEALAGLPLHKSFDAFVTIRNQIAAQQAPPPPPPKDTGGVAHQANGAATE